MQKRRLLFGAVLAACAMTMTAQSAWQPAHSGIGFGQASAKQWVQMVSSPELTVKAGKQAAATQDVDVQFAIQTGLHINSHTPNSHYLIPTTITLDAPTGVEIAKIEYPQGVDYHFQFAPKDALSVYTGEFGVRMHVHAKPGRYTIHGQLRYQACDDRACNPPKTLPLTLYVTAQ